MTPDPAGMVDGPNLYAYVLNDPVNFTDPSGLFLMCDSEGRCVETEDIVIVAPSPFTGVAFDHPPSNWNGPLNNTGRGSGTLAAPPMMMGEMRECDPNLVALGNGLVRAGEFANFASTAGIAIGLPVIVAGAVSLQPEIIAPGVAAVEAGAALGVIGGVLQLAGGLVQGFGGAGFDVAINAGASLAFGYGFGRLFATPGGYRTVSQRKLDEFINTSGTTFGGSVDLFMAMVPSEGEANCPGQ